MAKQNKAPENKKSADGKPGKQGKDAGKDKPVEGKPEKPESKIENRVRVAGVILDGNLEVPRAIIGVKGIGYRASRALCKSMGLDRNAKLSTLDEGGITKLEDAIASLNDKLPIWMLNRRKDYENGSDTHLVGPELDLTNRADIDRQKKIRSYKGVRHALKLPVRGQRTRSSFRKGITLGVVRKKNAAAQAQAKK